MKKVQARKWRDKGKGLGLEPTDALLGLVPVYSRFRIFQIHTLFLGLILFSLALGFYCKAGKVLALTLSVYGLILFFRTKEQAQGLQFTRSHNKTATELDPIQVHYDISNLSAFSLDSVLIEDSCSISQNPHQIISYNQPLDSFSQAQGTYRKKCDSGMGVRSIGPYKAWVADPIGLHEFDVIDEGSTPVEVYPKLEPITDPHVEGSHESHLFGVYDVPVRGQSVNFIGIRDYAPGDSLRQISWKLSAKHRKLLVKEFEKSVNAEITLVLNMRSNLHMGFGSQSTWEKAKDLTLALMANQTKTGNSVQLISNDFYLPFGHGDSHIHETVLKVFDCFPSLEVLREDPLDGMLEFVPYYSTVFYVTPLFAQSKPYDWKNLLLLREKHVNVQCFLVDSASFVQGQIQGDYKVAEGIAFGEGRKNMQNALETLNMAGIEVYVIRMNDSFSQALAQKVEILPGGAPR